MCPVKDCPDEAMEQWKDAEAPSPRDVLNTLDSGPEGVLCRRQDKLTLVMQSIEPSSHIACSVEQKHLCDSVTLLYVAAPVALVYPYQHG